MSKALPLCPSDLIALGRLATDAVAGVTDISQDVHREIASVFDPVGLMTAISSFSYAGVRAVNSLVGASLNAMATLSPPPDADQQVSRQREAIVAAVNGVLGDHLVATDNPLAITMSLRHCGRSLNIRRSALRSALPRPSCRILVLVHGLCRNDLQWQRKGHNHGTALARDLGYTPVYLHYNTGLHISQNGRLLADLLERLMQQWPTRVNEVAILGHSMGGLVARSACHYGVATGHRWPRRLRRLMFLGAPHHGAPFERLGNWVDGTLKISPYTAPFARVGQIRSAGITDMRYGSVLESDWAGRDRFATGGDVRGPLPLPRRVRCYTLAATRQKVPRPSTVDLLGDGLVPVDSALGRHGNPEMCLSFGPSRQQICYGTDHWALLDNRVYSHIKRWFGLR